MDYETYKNKQGFAFVNACKEPYHRQALGYKGRSCDKDNPEYLYAFRDNRLICNLVDTDLVEYVRPEIINACMIFIGYHLEQGENVLINCNLGESRSPIIAMLYLATIGYFKGLSFEEAEVKFKELYPKYLPRQGMRNYAKIKKLELVWHSW